MADRLKALVRLYNVELDALETINLFEPENRGMLEGKTCRCSPPMESPGTALLGSLRKLTAQASGEVNLTTLLLFRETVLGLIKVRAQPRSMAGNCTFKQPTIRELRLKDKAQLEMLDSMNRSLPERALRLAP